MRRRHFIAFPILSRCFSRQSLNGSRRILNVRDDLKDDVQVVAPQLIEVSEEVLEKLELWTPMIVFVGHSTPSLLAFSAVSVSS